MKKGYHSLLKIEAEPFVGFAYTYEMYWLILNLLSCASDSKKKLHSGRDTEDI